MKWPFDITRSVDKECKGKPEFLRKNFIKTYFSVEETNIDPIPWVPTLLFESKFNRRASNSDVNHLNHSVNINLMKWANIMRIAIDNITGSLRQFFFLCHNVMMWFLQPQTMGRTSWNHCYRFHFHFDDKYENIRRKNSIDADGNLISVSMVYELLKV